MRAVLKEGTTQTDLARAFGLTVQRIHTMVHSHRGEINRQSD